MSYHIRELLFFPKIFLWDIQHAAIVLYHVFCYPRGFVVNEIKLNTLKCE